MGTYVKIAFHTRIKRHWSTTLALNEYIFTLRFIFRRFVNFSNSLYADLIYNFGYFTRKKIEQRLKVIQTKSSLVSQPKYSSMSYITIFVQTHLSSFIYILLILLSIHSPHRTNHRELRKGLVALTLLYGCVRVAIEFIGTLPVGIGNGFSSTNKSRWTTVPLDGGDK